MPNEWDRLLPEQQTPTLTSLFERPISTALIRPDEEEDENNGSNNLSTYLVPLVGTTDDTPDCCGGQNCGRVVARCTATTNDTARTMTGSVVFLIYHVVFCLAQAATITRPHCTHSSTGLLAKTAALGVVTAGPVFVWQLGGVVPAIYPASDLFLAPFLAELAERIDEVLAARGMPEDDDVFLATFLVTASAGLLLSGTMCIAAARFKLANLGAFLPSSVLGGFFTTIGVLMWTLGFSVDTGMKVGQVWHYVGKDTKVVTTALFHHAPSLVVGVVMHMAGRQHPNWVIALIVATVLCSYGVLWATGTTLQQAQDAKWFFAAEDLIPPVVDEKLAGTYGPPHPFGFYFAAWRGQVVWEAAAAGIPTVLALAFLYVIRCSLHSAALKKNIPNVTRKKVVKRGGVALTAEMAAAKAKKRKEDKQRLALGSILERGYGYSQLIAAAFGGITVAPSVAASLTLFHLGAEATPPQYGSCALLLLFYWTDFRLVQYIPKPAFSCLMVLAGIDMCRSWIVGSWFKTKDKLEWTVAPCLVVLAFAVGVLNAIFLGVAASTFIFAANMYRAGTVKYVGSGLSLRSRVERGPREAGWLDQNADLIQILVLQNYLFFGTYSAHTTEYSAGAKDCLARM